MKMLKNTSYKLPILQLRILMIFLFLSCLSCNCDVEEKSDPADRGSEVEITFDKTKWSIKEGKDYPFRDQMLNDIVYNDTVRELNKDEILELLGEPSYYRENENFLYYTITEKRLGFWTLHSKTLVIKLSEDYTIDWIKIHE